MGCGCFAVLNAWFRSLLPFLHDGEVSGEVGHDVADGDEKTPEIVEAE